MTYSFSQPNLYTCTYTHTHVHTCMHTLAHIYRHKFLVKNVHKLCEITHEINQQWLPIISSPAGGNRVPKMLDVQSELQHVITHEGFMKLRTISIAYKTYESTYNSCCVLYKYSLSNMFYLQPYIKKCFAEHISQQCYYVRLILIIMTVVHHIY